MAADQPDELSERLFFQVSTAPVVIPSGTVPDPSIGDEQEDNDQSKVVQTNPFISDTGHKRPAPDEILDTKYQKKLKMNTPVHGGRAPTFKPITVDLDEEDQLLVNMKKQGYKDEEIADKLAELGGTRYQPKTIHSRYNRLFKKAQEYEEKLLHEDLSDWHDGEDELLRDANAVADKKLEAEIEKLKAKRWTWVAREVNSHADRPRFSANACRNRSRALENGTARYSADNDADPEVRKREREQRTEEFRKRKAENEEREAAEAAKQKQIKAQNTAQKVASRERGQARTAIRAQKKKEDAESRRRAKDKAKQSKQFRKNHLQKAKAWRVYKLGKDRIFNKVLKELRDRAKERAAVPKKKKTRNSNEVVDPNIRVKSRYKYKNTLEELAALDTTESRATEAAIEARAAHFAGVVEAVGTAEVQADLPMAKPDLPMTNPSRLTADGRVDVFGEDPRSMLTVNELWDVLRGRNMLLNRMKDSKPVILSRLRNEDRNATMEELQRLLLERDETEIGGSKDDLLRRLAIADAKTSRHYQSKYTNRPLNEKGNRMRVKKPTKPALSGAVTRYSAREASMKPGNIPIKSKKRPTASQDMHQSTLTPFEAAVFGLEGHGNLSQSAIPGQSSDGAPVGGRFYIGREDMKEHAGGTNDERQVHNRSNTGDEDMKDVPGQSSGETQAVGMYDFGGMDINYTPGTGTGAIWTANNRIPGLTPVGTRANQAPGVGSVNLNYVSGLNSDEG